MRTTLLALLALFALPSTFATAGAPPPKEPNCRAVYEACIGGGYIQGDAKEGNGLWKDCITPLMTGATPPKAPPAGVTFPAMSPTLSQQIQTCHKNHPKFGMPH